MPRPKRDLDIEWLREEYEGGKTIADLAPILGVDPSTVAKYLRAAGVAMRPAVTTRSTATGPTRVQHGAHLKRLVQQRDKLNRQIDEAILAARAEDVPWSVISGAVNSSIQSLSEKYAARARASNPTESKD